MTTVILFIFGTIIGSFLNVVGGRWDSKQFGGRSHCEYCKKTLKWWELVPVLSIFILRRKCSLCSKAISWQYLLIEIFTGLIFVTVPYFAIPVFLIYVVILIYDLEHKIIPDVLVYLAILLSLVYAFFFRDNTFFDWLAGPLIWSFFGSIWILSRGRAMGFGDAKLGLSIGLLLGASAGFSAIVLSFWIGTAFYLVYSLLGRCGFINEDKKLTMKSEIPFAPFIILGAWVSLIFNLNLFYVLSI